MKYHFLFFMLTVVSIDAQSPFVHVDQYGYTPDAIKIAVLSDPQVGANSALSYSPADSLELWDVTNNVLVEKIEPAVWMSGATHADWSGDRGWWLDFSTVNEIGSYMIIDPVSMDTSAIFDIAPTSYDEVLRAATRMYYYNRCNYSKSAPYAEADWVDSSTNFEGSLQDANCRYIYDQSNASLEKDLTGGWFDAGDYNKYVPFTISTLHNLIWAYQENPEIFTDDYNIPESGNGIPDLIDEIKYELDWLRKMTNPDGSTHIKMGSKNYSENTSYPPSANTDPRYYGPTCTSASLTIASVFAHASKVFADFPALIMYAEDLEDEAIAAWDYVLPYYNAGTLELNCDDGSIVSGDADFGSEMYQESMIAAAIYLFDLTENSVYDDFVKNNYLQSLVFGATANVPGNVSTYYDDWWDINYIHTKDAYLHYGTIAGHDAGVAQDFYDSFQAMIDNDWNDFLGTNDRDLYRAYLPSYFLGWGSNSSEGRMGVLNYLITKYGLDGGSPDIYLEKMASHIHYIHGVNPLGISYLSNMYGKGADRCADEIYHTWFADGSQWDNVNTSYGPAPGFLAGGANHTYTGSLAPPSGEPYLKAYAHFNDVPNVSWEITEPGIYYQAAYIRNLAELISLDTTQTNISYTANIEVTDTDILVYPNPSNAFYVLEGMLMSYNISVLNSSGQVVMSIAPSGNQEIIDASQLGPGLYFIRLEHKTNNNLIVQKIIAQ